MKKESLEAQSQKTGRTSSAQIHQTILPPSIRACPALRAPGSTPRVKPARGIPPEADCREERKRRPGLSPDSGICQHKSHAPERALLATELQQLYAEGKHAEILAQVEAYLPKDEACNFIA